MFGPVTAVSPFTLTAKLFVRNRSFPKTRRAFFWRNAIVSADVAAGNVAPNRSLCPVETDCQRRYLVAACRRCNTFVIPKNNSDPAVRAAGSRAAMCWRCGKRQLRRRTALCGVPAGFLFATQPVAECRQHVASPRRLRQP